MEQSNPRWFRVVFVGSLITLMIGVIALTGWLLWPEWQRYSALRRLEQAGRARDAEKFLDAVEAIGKLPADERLVSDLVERVKDRDPGVRAYSIITLAVLQPRPVSVVPLLIATLDDPDEDDSVRAAAAAALEPFGEDANDAVPSLMRAAIIDGGYLGFAAADTVLALELSGVIPLHAVFSGFRVPVPSDDARIRDRAHYLSWRAWPDLPQPMNFVPGYPDPR